MKKLVILLSILFCAIVSFAQYPINQNLGAPKTLINVKGGLGVDSSLVFIYNFADTTTASLGFLDNIPGNVIRAKDTLWQRNNAATAWIKLGSGGGATTPTWQQTLIAGSTLNQTNDIEVGNNAFRFLNTSDFEIQSNSDIRITADSEMLIEVGDSLRVVGINESASTGLNVLLENPATGAVTKTPITDVGENVIAGRGVLKNIDTIYGNFIDSALIDSLQQIWSPIGTWGNSLTFGSLGIIGGYPTYLMQLARRYVYNGGAVGEIAASVMARFMAQPAYFRRPNVIWVGRNDIEAS